LCLQENEDLRFMSLAFWYPAPCGDHAGDWVAAASIGVCEVVKHCLLARRLNLVHYSLVAGTSVIGRPVKVSPSIQDYARLGLSTVRKARKAMQSTVSWPNGSTLKTTPSWDAGLAGRAAEHGGAIKVAGGVERHACSRIAPVRPAGETVEHRLLPGGLQLLHRAEVPGAARPRSPVQVTLGIPHHRRSRYPTRRRPSRPSSIPSGIFPEARPPAEP